MPLPQVWLVALLVVVGAALFRRPLRQHRLPQLPEPLILGAVLSWAILASLPLDPLPNGYRSWVRSLDDLLFSYLAVRMVLWVFLELPAALGWRKQPPRILVQLLLLAGGTLATVIVVQEQARFDLVGLVTTSAVLTAMIGLAAQEPLKDLLAGLELQFDDVFKEGDFIDLGDGTAGMVMSINWRDTCLKDICGALVVVPNTRVTEVVMRNYGTFGTMGNRFSLGLDYALPPAQARALLLSVLRQHPLVLAEPPPSVRVKAFEDSAIAYEILAFQPPGSLAAMLELRSDLLEQIWYALERIGQSIPYPVRELRPKRASLDPAHPTHHSQEGRGALLERNPLFVGLSAEEKLSLAAHTCCLRFAPGEVVVREGAHGDSLFQVVTGSVEVLKEQASGPAVRVACLHSGELFGEMSMLTDSPRSATVRTVEESVLLEVSRQQLAPLLQRNPPLMDRLAHLVSERRGQLEGLAQERVEVQENQLLRRMQQLFASLTW